MENDAFTGELQNREMEKDGFTGGQTKRKMENDGFTGGHYNRKMKRMDLQVNSRIGRWKKMVCR